MEMHREREKFIEENRDRYDNKAELLLAVNKHLSGKFRDEVKMLNDEKNSIHGV